MKVLQVIHGYPMRFNAGSEVYTQTLSRSLAARHDVRVFTREDDPFKPECALQEETDPADARIRLHLLNLARSRDRYRHAVVDDQFGRLLDSFAPDVVHIGHLSHLSTSVVLEASRRAIPIVFTLHDYWLMCPRGQLIQAFPVDETDPWAICSGQEDRKCAQRCYARSFSGASADYEQDVSAWTGWVKRRMSHIREMCDRIDVFVAPSHFLRERFVRDFGLPASKIRYLDYGFDHERLAGRMRATSEVFTFGYIGTHTVAKGIHLLIDAFARVPGNSKLRIWGRAREETPSLRARVNALPMSVRQRITWEGEYENQRIVRDVFNHVDAVVVPSIWVENSPLVIHEAQQARVPLITANIGGMAEYVRNEVNGLLFRHRDAADLAAAMTRLSCDPDLANRLGERGYLASDGDVVSAEQHSEDVELIYGDVVRRRDAARVPVLPGPWRITFDTNPDDCNLECIMCEEHSPLSERQPLRRLSGKPPRRMDLGLIRRVLEDSRGTGLREIIPSTMGEPLLYADFEAILDLCREYGVRMNLTTNGTFPRLGARAWAEKIVPVTSDTKISWNGATASTHESIMLGSQWGRAVENVREFVAVRDEHAAAGGNRCRVTFQLTFLESNISELSEIVALAAQLGVDRVKGHHVWAHFDELKKLSLRRTKASIVSWNAAIAEAMGSAERHRLASGERVLLENFFPLDEDATSANAMDGACPFLGREAWISAEGRFNPCCAPDAERRSLGDFGSLEDVKIGEIWRSNTYRELVAAYRSRTPCRSCNLRKPHHE